MNLRVNDQLHNNAPSTNKTDALSFVSNLGSAQRKSPDKILDTATVVRSYLQKQVEDAQLAMQSNANGTPAHTAAKKTLESIKDGSFVLNGAALTSHSKSAVDYQGEPINANTAAKLASFNNKTLKQFTADMKTYYTKEGNFYYFPESPSPEIQKYLNLLKGEVTTIETLQSTALVTATPATSHILDNLNDVAARVEAAAKDPLQKSNVQYKDFKVPYKDENGEDRGLRSLKSYLDGAAYTGGNGPTSIKGKIREVAAMPEGADKVAAQAALKRIQDAIGGEVEVQQGGGQPPAPTSKFEYKGIDLSTRVLAPAKDGFIVSNTESDPVVTGTGTQSSPKKTVTNTTKTKYFQGLSYVLSAGTNYTKKLNSEDNKEFGVGLGVNYFSYQGYSQTDVVKTTTTEVTGSPIMKTEEIQPATYSGVSVTGFAGGPSIYLKGSSKNKSNLLTSDGKPVKPDISTAWRLNIYGEILRRTEYKVDPDSPTVKDKVDGYQAQRDAIGSFIDFNVGLAGNKPENVALIETRGQLDATWYNSDDPLKHTEKRKIAYFARVHGKVSTPLQRVTGEEFNQGKRSALRLYGIGVFQGNGAADPNIVAPPTGGAPKIAIGGGLDFAPNKALTNADGSITYSQPLKFSIGWNSPKNNPPLTVMYPWKGFSPGFYVNVSYSIAPKPKK